MVNKSKSILQNLVSCSSDFRPKTFSYIISLFGNRSGSFYLLWPSVKYLDLDFPIRTFSPIYKFIRAYNSVGAPLFLSFCTAHQQLTLTFTFPLVTSTITNSHHYVQRCLDRSYRCSVLPMWYVSLLSLYFFPRSYPSRFLSSPHLLH